MPKKSCDGEGAASRTPTRKKRRAVDSEFEEEEDVAVAPSSGFGSWEEVAATQGLTSVQLLFHSHAGQAFALEDRNTFAESWRRVFVVPRRFEGPEFVEVFDSRSNPIDEPSHGVKNGLQLATEFADECYDYYRLPELRQPPRDRSGCSPATPKRARTGAAAAASADIESSDHSPGMSGAVAESELQHDAGSSMARKGCSQLLVMYSDDDSAEDDGEREDCPSADAVDEGVCTDAEGSGTNADVSIVDEGGGIDEQQGGGTDAGGSSTNADGGIIDEGGGTNEQHGGGTSDAGGGTYEGRGIDEGGGIDERSGTDITGGGGIDAGGGTDEGSTVVGMGDPPRVRSDCDDSGEGARCGSVASSQLAVSQRVQVLIEGRTNTGVVAGNSGGCLMIALDKCDWLIIPDETVCEWTITASKDNIHWCDGETSDHGVVALSYTDAVRAPGVTGMLIGVAGDTLLRGSMPAYYAHFAKPAYGRSESHHLRSRKETYLEKSFAVGNVVAWNGDRRGLVRAAVVRVLYKPRSRSSTNGRSDQSRKLLILMELFQPGTRAPARDPTIFPASWSKWERVPLCASGWGSTHPYSVSAQALSLSTDAIKAMEEVSMHQHAHVTNPQETTAIYMPHACSCHAL